MTRWPTFSSSLLTSAVTGLVLSFAGCDRGTVAAGAKGVTADAAGALVVYSGRGEVLVGPLFTRFTKATGIAVELRYGQTPELAVRLAQEGADTQADIFFAQDSGYLGALEARGLLAELPDELLAGIDARFREPGARWAPTSGRMRVLVYNATRLTTTALPQRLEDLAALAPERFRGRVGWAPQNGSFEAHVSALRHLWGEERARAWLGAMQALEPKRYAKNGPQVDAVARGEVDLAWVNHYYLHKARQRDAALPVAIWSFPEPGDAGNLLMTSGVAVTARARRPRAARELVRFLLSEPAQAYFAQETFEYPTREGVPAHADVAPLAGLSLAEVRQRHLTDLEPTLRLLQAAGLR